MKHLQACLSATTDGECDFHHSGSLVNLVQACLSARKDRESSFHHCGVADKRVQACLSAGKVRVTILTTVEALGSSCKHISEPTKIEKASFGAVEVLSNSYRPV